jgi:hypothetical protein
MSMNYDPYDNSSSVGHIGQTSLKFDPLYDNSRDSTYVYCIYTAIIWCIMAVVLCVVLGILAAIIFLHQTG